MRLFAYYAIHSFINTIKKMLKTWLAIFIVAMVFGGVIGGVVGLAASSEEEEVVTEEEIEGTTEESELNFFESRGIDRDTFVDFLSFWA